MTLSGGCANKNLIRFGGGSVRSLVVLVFMAIAAYMTLKGLFGQWRASLLDPVALNLADYGWKDQSLATAVARLTGMTPAAAQGTSLAVLVSALLVFVFKDKRFRANRVQMVGAVVIGALVVAGWYVSGHLGYGENPETLEFSYFATNSRTLESMSFVGPMAYGLELLMLWTDKSLHVTFGIASALGVVARFCRLRAERAHVSLGRVCAFLPRPAQPAPRRGADGFWRRDGVGLHRRPGHHRPLDAGPRLVHRSRRHRRRRRRHAEVHALARRGLTGTARLRGRAPKEGCRTVEVGDEVANRR